MKNKKNKRKNKKKTKEVKGKGTTRLFTCEEKINTYLYYTAMAVTNFDKQLKRANTQYNLVGKKAEKRGNFTGIKNNVQEAGGGSKTEPSCGGNKTNTGATGLKYLIGNLSACNASIEKACITDMPKSPNDTELANCKNASQEWWWKMGHNTKKNGSALCTAFENADT